jgi:hypothetical protein
MTVLRHIPLPAARRAHERPLGTMRTATIILWAFLVVLLGMLTACDEVVRPCEVGTVDCACGEGLTCGDGLFCGAGDVCIEPPCELGTAGCACGMGGVCGVEAGQRLLCLDSLCVPSSCRPGSLGCGCVAGRCEGDAVCAREDDGEFCRTPDCLLGEEGCGCRTDQTCGTTATGLALACDEGICVVPDCTPGAPGCLCRGDRSCDGGQACNALGRCGPPSCSRGQLGCACEADGTCRSSDAVCEGGICSVPSCPTGAEGCACRADLRCDATGPTGVLVCEAGRCVGSACVQGDRGCGCRSDGRCNGGDLVCDRGLCAPIRCAPGALDCICRADDVCDDGLTCRNGLTCVDATGFAGGACGPGGQCQRGNRCEEGVCRACSTGGLGCTCFENGTCRTGMTCRGGTCVDANDLVARIPQPPVCYSPCSAAGETLASSGGACGEDGLVEGCVGTQRCVDGSCVLPGESPPTCRIATDCPPWQSCISGRCYSTCDDAHPCDASDVCHLRVCRRTCGEDRPCAAGFACDLRDGRAGVCLPETAPLGEPRAVPAIVVESSEIVFTPERPRGSLTVVNPADEPVQVRVQKVEHAYVDRDVGRIVVRNRADDAGCAEAGECPLSWLRVDTVRGGQRGQRLEFALGPREERVVFVEEAAAGLDGSWEGVIEVGAVGGPPTRVALAYREGVAGYFTGTLLAFGAFDNEGVDAWAAGTRPATETTNAWIQIWDNFRSGRVPYEELRAALRSIRTESWAQPRVIERCLAATGTPQARCFPSNNADGVSVLTPNIRSQSLPTGAWEREVAVWLDDRPGGCGPGTAQCWGGAIDSDVTASYPAFPLMTVGVQTDPAACARTSADGCLTRLSWLSATVRIGGRRAPAGSTCPGTGFQVNRTPVLTAPLLGGAGVRVIAGVSERVECVDERSPWVDRPEANRALASTSPTRDGRASERTLRLLDGYLIGQDVLLALVVEEQTPVIPGSAPSQLYGVLALTRQPPSSGEIPAPEPQVPASVGPDAEAPTLFGCAPELESRLRAPSRTNVSAWANHMARGVLDGVATDSSPSPLRDSHDLHYLCVDTGLFNGGRGVTSLPQAALPCEDTCGRARDGVCDDGGAGSTTDACAFGSDCTDCGPRYAGDTEERIACPSTSEVRYFAVRGDQMSAAAVAAHPCQLDGSCADVLGLWVRERRFGILVDVPWRCSSLPLGGGELAPRERCEDDPRELRWGREFLDPDDGTQVLPPLAVAIDSAFRYRADFPTRAGGTLGFAPRPCTGDATRDAYCFDPAGIASLAQRHDCALSLYLDHGDRLTGSLRQRLEETLSESFGGRETRVAREAPRFVPGFERMLAELELLMADEALAVALGSRFDLVQASVETFDGPSLEPGAPVLSGGTGSELVALYRAEQFYRRVLDRFFDRAAGLLVDVQTAPRPLMTAETLEVWVSRVLLASTQRVRVLAQTARRWHELGRPDLARSVLERAQVAAQLDAASLIAVLDGVQRGVVGAERDQATRFLEDAMRRYSVATSELQGLRATLGEATNPFGFDDDYVPFPALASATASPVALLLQRAAERIDLAARSEARAIEERTNIDTSDAGFRSELTAFRVESDERLGAICGTFATTINGVARTVPAIRRYASLSPDLVQVGDPCGLVGNGALFEAALDLEVATEELQLALTRLEALEDRIDRETERIERQCEITLDVAEVVFGAEGDVAALLRQRERAELIKSTVKTTISSVLEVIDLLRCEVGLSTDCPMAAAALGIYTVGAIVSIAGSTTLQVFVNTLQDEIRQIERNSARSERVAECDSFRLNGAIDLQQLALQRANAELALVQGQLAVQVMAQRIEALTHEVRRLEAEEAEARDLLIASASASMDPNLRLYRNSSIRLADDTFRSAQRSMWQAIRAFEYVTGQRWGGRDDLLLTRMVRAGSPSLEELYEELEDAWIAWRESAGDPELRLVIVSLRDDVLGVPRTDERGRPLSYRERVEQFRRELLAPERRDAAGRFTYAFPTTLSQVSPWTAGHRIAWIEAELIGSDVGDPTGRVTLRQTGTSAMRVTGRTVRYFRFPERTAVLDVFFNGQRFFPDEVYRSLRHAGRPFVQTRWELILDSRQDEVNQDIRLASLTDVRLYIYLTDVTDPSAF